MTRDGDLRLVAPQLTDAELVFLTELGRLEKMGVEAAIADLNHALLHNDVEAGIRAARRFTSLGQLMYDAQQKVATPTSAATSRRTTERREP